MVYISHITLVKNSKKKKVILVVNSAGALSLSDLVC